MGSSAATIRNRFTLVYTNSTGPSSADSTAPTSSGTASVRSGAYQPSTSAGTSRAHCAATPPHATAMACAREVKPCSTSGCTP